MQTAQTVQTPAIDPWRLDVVVVRQGSHTSAERRTIQRDHERGLLRRLGRGLYVERLAFESLSPEGQHIVRMRALTAASDRPLLFSHWSAAVVHGLPVLRSRIEKVHVTVGAAGGMGPHIAAHSFDVSGPEVVRVHDLLVTEAARTVVDLAGAAPFEEGVMAADALLHAGSPRDALELAVDLAGPRQSSSRIDDVVAFAHPAAESAIESRGRVTMMRLGVEVPVLQREFLLPSGRRVRPDFWFPEADVAAEGDGDVKYLDRDMAPAGAGAAVLAEKRREDELRALLRGLARFGWVQSASTAMLGPLLARAGVVPEKPRTRLADYCAAARGATSGFVPRRRASAPR